MNVEPASVLLQDSGMVHDRAEAITLDRVPAVQLLGLWQNLRAAQENCQVHDEVIPGRPDLTWQQLYNGLWEARTASKRYQVVLRLGPLH